MINSGDVYTISTAVALTLSCDDSGGSGCGEMQFSNDNIDWSTPETFTSTKTWELTAGDATKTVYARFQDSLGHWSTTYTDSIVLDTSAPGSISINDGEGYTNSTSVTLNLSSSHEASLGKFYFPILSSFVLRKTLLTN